jgi:hypothetical protein
MLWIQLVRNSTPKYTLITSEHVYKNVPNILAHNSHTLEINIQQVKDKKNGGMFIQWNNSGKILLWAALQLDLKVLDQVKELKHTYIVHNSI